MTILEWAELLGATLLYFVGHLHGKKSGLANQGIALAKQVVSSLPPPNTDDPQAGAAGAAAGAAAYNAGKNAGK